MRLILALLAVSAFGQGPLPSPIISGGSRGGGGTGTVTQVICPNGTITTSGTCAPITGAIPGALVTAGGATGPLQTPVALQGNGPIVVGSAGPGVSPGMFYPETSPSSCTVATVGYTTSLNCAMALANAYATANSVGTTVQLGSNYYPFCQQLANTNAALYGTSVIGTGSRNTWLVPTCNITAVNDGEALYSGATGGTFSTFAMKGFSIIGNADINSCGDFYAVNVPQFEDLSCEGPLAATSTHMWKFGDQAAFGTRGFFGGEIHTVTSQGTASITSLASITANLSGGSLASYTLNSGGAGYVTGYATANLAGACSVFPGNPTLTLTGSAISAVTPTGGAGSGCTTLYVQSYNVVPNQIGIDARGASDTRFHNSQPTGSKIGMQMDAGGNNFSFGDHPTNNAIGMIVGANNTIFGPESDTSYSIGVEFTGTGGTSLFGGNAFTPSTVSPGYIAYYLASGANNMSITGVSTPCAGGTPTGFVALASNLGVINASNVSNSPNGLNYSETNGSCGVGGVIMAGLIINSLTFNNGFTVQSGSAAVFNGSPFFNAGQCVGSGCQSYFDGSGTQQISSPVSTSLASVAGASTVAITQAFTTISGSGTINTFGLPSRFNGTIGGCVDINPASGATWTTSTGGNIGAVSVAIPGKVLRECYDGSKWWPSY